MNEILTTIGQNWFTNILGTVGGSLGIWTFIDSYLIRFVPKIYIGTKVIIDTKQTPHREDLESIICSLELCNHRKRYGVIYDFAVRVYKADEINSDNAIYYASQLVNKIPINVDELKNQEYELFNPITILPESNSSVNLVLGEVLNRSKMHISKSSNYYLEAYYQKKPEGKWYFIDKLYLYNKGQYSQSTSQYIQFSVLNTNATREKLNKKIRPQKTNLYLGASHKHLSGKWIRYRYLIFYRPLRRIKDLFYSVPFYTNFALSFVIDKFIRIPIIKKYGKNITKANITIGSPKNRIITENAFEEIYAELGNLVSKINNGANKEAKISLEKRDKEIILSRYKLAIKFYIPGDQWITVQDLNTQFGSRMTYNLSLEKAIWNKNYWKLKNYGFISIKSFSVKVVDAFIIHSNY
jgi:hypothetical protein